MKFQTKPVKLIILFILAALGGAGVLLTGCGEKQTTSSTDGTATEKTLYTCGMHPQVVQDHPGNCPICGMTLTPIRKQTSIRSAGTNMSAKSGEHKIKYYKSTMKPGEARQTPGKDSMGMDMVPVYEDEAAAAESRTITIDPVTIQTMDI